MKNNKGITLIALVITIIVMLILVGVTITMAVNGGLFNYAGNAVRATNIKLQEEGELAEGGVKVNGEWYNSIDEYLVASGNKAISKDKSYIGCYADVDGDGDADGVIYADLAVGNTKDGQWDWKKYNVPKETDLTLLKNYYVSGTADGTFGNGVEVLTATGEGKDRFYVMALQDLSATACTWYASKWEDGITVSTSEDFGTGKANTITMIELWNEDENEEKSSNDIWGIMQNSEEYDIVETVNDSGRWFLPSLSELTAFSEELGITYDNYIDFGLSASYSSSSEYGEGSMCVDYTSPEIRDPELNCEEYVRLSTTF